MIVRSERNDDFRYAEASRHTHALVVDALTTL
jgi:hypothetical protein